MEIQQLINSLVFLIPLGIIGLYRWCAWLLKVYLSSRYRQPQGDGSTNDWKVAAALTVKGEGVAVFRRTLEGLVAENIDQVSIVFDEGETENIRLFLDFQRLYPHIDFKMETTNEKGKRKGLKRAIAIVDDYIHVILVMDSDTFLTHGVKSAVLKCFCDPEIGGVAVRQRIYRPQKLIDHVFDLTLHIRFENDIKGQALGKRVSVLSGRCSGYLAPVLKEIAQGLNEEVWMGIRKTGGGEDKFLTTGLYDRGYKSVMVDDAFVYTRPEGKIGLHLNQRLRWARNSWFSDLRALFTRSWMWKSPILLFYTTDRMVSAFTLLLGPWYFVFAFAKHDWLSAGIILWWWLGSRLLKGYPYFKQTKRYWMAPVFIFTTFLFGVIKLHALVTIGETSWLTRGNTDTRLFSRLSWIVTAMLILLLGVLVAGPLSPK